MSVTSLLIFLIVIGVVWYLVKTYIPLPGPIKTVVTVIAVLILCLLLLNLFGIGDFQIGRPIK